MTRKILIEDGLSLKLERGVGQYTKRLYEILALDYSVEMPRKTFLEGINNNVVRRILYILWLNTVFVFKLLFNKDSLICFFPATITPFIKFKEIKYISVIHDIRSIEHPELSTKIQNFHINFANYSAFNFADKILTVSQTMQQSIAKYYELIDVNIYVVYNTFSLKNVLYDESEEILKILKIRSKEYLLFVGGLDKNKNINMTISAFEKIHRSYSNLKLIIVGSIGNDKIISNNPNIIFTGFISNEDIKVLYKNALIYLFPSIYEGFGIPIIDAQLLEVPGICSDIPVFREIAGDGALFIDLTVDSFVSKLDNLLKDSQLKNLLIMKGKENITRFTEEKIKEQLNSVFVQE